MTMEAVVLKAAAQLGPAVFIAVVAVLVMGAVLNQYDKRRREDFNMLHKQHIDERSEWRKSMSDMTKNWNEAHAAATEKTSKASEKILDKLTDVLIELNRK